MTRVLWLPTETEALIKLYSQPRLPGSLIRFAYHHKRSYHSVNAKARALGLTDKLWNERPNLEEMATLRDQGLTFSEIGRRHKISGVRVFQLLRERGLKPFSREILEDFRSGLAPTDWEELKEFYGSHGAKLDAALRPLFSRGYLKREVTITLVSGVSLSTIETSTPISKNPITLV